MTRRTAWTKRPPGGDRSGSVQSERSKRKISESMRRYHGVRRAATEHAQGEKVRRKLFQDAEDKVYRDAIDYLLAHQLEPAEALREIVGDREHPDRMRAVGGVARPDAREAGPGAAHGGPQRGVEPRGDRPDCSRRPRRSSGSRPPQRLPTLPWLKRLRLRIMAGSLISYAVPMQSDASLLPSL